MMTNSPPYAALRAFEAVGRLRGIRRAAEALGTSHAAVSRHLNGLEAQLGACLFDRDARQLTEIGRGYHERIGRALAEINAATLAVITAQRGQLRIICAPGLALHWLTSRLAGFSGNSNSPLIVDLQADDAAPDFANDEIDGDIRYLPNATLGRRMPGIRCVQLASPSVFPVASPELVARLTGQLRTVDDFMQLPLIEERDGSEWTGWFAEQQRPAAAFSRVARYGHAHLALAAARAGQGIALANSFLAADDLLAGRLVHLFMEKEELQPARLGAYVFRASHSKWDDPRVTRFRNWLVREFAKAEQDRAGEYSE